MPMKTRVLEETKTAFEKELQGHEADGWIPNWKTKQTVVITFPNEEFPEIVHTILLQKWED